MRSDSGARGEDAVADSGGNGVKLSPEPGRRRASVRTRRFIRLLAGLTVFALLLRLLVCWQLADVDSVRAPWSGTDMATYRDLATAILRGHFPDSFYYQPFYYAVFLPAVYAVFGVNHWGPMLVQALLGAATVWLTGWLTARVFGRRAGLAAAGLLALARMHVFYTPFLLIAVLQSFWMTLLTVVVLWAWRRRGWCAWLPVAAVAAAAILTRGNVLLLLPGILLLLVWRLRQQPLRAAAAVLLFGLCVLLVQLPFAWRNARHHGRWTGPSTAQDAVLALGNTPEAPPGGLEYTPTYRYWLELADRAPPRRVPVSRQMLHWFRRQPLAFFELKWRTLLLFWHRQEIPNNVALAREGRHSVLLRGPFLLGFGVLGTLGLAGLLLQVKTRSVTRLFLVQSVLVYCLATVLFYMLARFRVPVLPLLCVFGGAAVERLHRLWRRRACGSWLPTTVLAFAAAVFVVFSGYPFYQQFFESAVMRWVRPDGVLVRTGSRTRLYDHGSRLCGGWLYVPVSAEPVVVWKRFLLPAAPPGGRRQTRLRIPIRARSGARLDIEVLPPAGAPVRDSFTAAASPELQWLTLPVPEPPPAAGVAVWEVRFRRRRGETAFAVDMYRDYGRTLVGLPGAGSGLDTFEAAFELEWEAGPPPPAAEGEVRR